MALLALCFAGPGGSSAAPDREMRSGGGAAVAGDAWRALSAGPGLEVRDANNQAVSRTVVEREIKAGSFALLVQAASLVSLPKSRLLLEMLERAALLAASLRRRGPFSGSRETLSATLPLRKPALLPARNGEACAFSSDSCPKSPFSSSFPAVPVRSLPLVLRC